MPLEDTKILELNQYRKLYKTSFFSYAYLEFFLEKIDGFKTNLKRSSITKVG